MIWVYGCAYGNELTSHEVLHVFAWQWQVFYQAAWEYEPKNQMLV